MKKLTHILFNCDENTIKTVTNHFSLVSLVKKIDFIPVDKDQRTYEIILNVPEDTTEEQIFCLGILMGAYDFKIK